MTHDPKLVEAVARAVCAAIFQTPFERTHQFQRDICAGLSTAALTALCAHLRITPEALRALADDPPRAVVVPKEEVERVADWFHDYAEGHAAQGKWDKAERNGQRRDFVRHWLAASPYAREAGDE